MAIVLLEVVREMEGNNGETGVVIGAALVAAVRWSIELLGGILQDMLAFGTVNVADASVPSCGLKRFTQETGVCLCRQQLVSESASHDRLEDEPCNSP